MQQVEALYYSFDTNTRARSTETVLNVLNASGMLGCGKMSAEALFRAVPLISANFDFSVGARDPIVNRVIDRRMELVKAFQSEICDWEKATKNASVALRRRLSTQGALAVALMTFRHQKARAVEFWGGVADNDGLKRGDPRHAYLTLLTQGQNQNSSHIAARHACVAWNAWYRRADLKIIKVIEGSPFRILGTPVGK